MFNRPNRNDVDDGVQDIQNDVNQLADSLESVLCPRAATPSGKLKPHAVPGVAERNQYEYRTRVQVSRARCRYCKRILLFVKTRVAWVQQLRSGIYRRTLRKS